MNFSISLANAVAAMKEWKDTRVFLINDYSSDIYNCRNALLLPDSFKNGLKEPFAPFAGKIDYDWMLWIDSDMVFKPEDVERILSHNVDMVSGICPIDQERAAIARFYLEDGKRIGLSYFSIKGIPNANREENGLISIDFTGFAFTAVRRGVFEAITHPWFRFQHLDCGDRQIQTSEDFGMCERIREAGFSIWADPEVKIGHEKQMVLMP